MPSTTIIRQWFVLFGESHRAVAAHLRLPLHVVMHECGLMDDALFREVNS